MNARVFFDAVLFDANADGFLVFEYEAEQKRLPTFPMPVFTTQGAARGAHESRNIGKVGAVQASRCPDADGRWLYRFSPYLDQTPRPRAATFPASAGATSAGLKGSWHPAG